MGKKPKKSHFRHFDFGIFWGANPPSDFDADPPITPNGQSPVGRNFKIGHPAGRFTKLRPPVFVPHDFGKIFEKFPKFGGTPQGRGFINPRGQSEGLPFAPKTGRLRRPVMALRRPKILPSPLNIPKLGRQISPKKFAGVALDPSYDP
mgnify:CR=1 FL=1